MGKKKKENQSSSSARPDFIEVCAVLKGAMNVQLPYETYVVDGPMIFDADVIRSLKERDPPSTLKKNKKR